MDNNTSYSWFYLITLYLFRLNYFISQMLYDTLIRDVTRKNEGLGLYFEKYLWDSRL